MPTSAIVTTAEVVTEPSRAVIVAREVVGGTEVVIGKEADEAPAEIVLVAGTDAYVTLEPKATVKPPFGAGPVRLI